MPAVTPDSAPWRARPVFISSTFRDMQAERDYLRSHVFPRLEERLRERRHHFEPIDLRMGVETVDEQSMEQRELLVLKVCLDEVKRSRPFLIVLLGDRYGWVPPPERMETAVQEIGFETDVRNKSVTALEIEFGVLKQSEGQRSRSFFYFRDPLPYDRMSPEMVAYYSDTHSPDPATHAGHRQLQSLKNQIFQASSLAPRVHRYQAEWDERAQRVTGLEAFGDMVFEHLWAALDQETHAFASQPPETWDQRERSALIEFVDQRRRDFTGRASLMQKLIAHATSPISMAARATTAVAADSSWAVCITGTPGSGKSAVIAEVFHRFGQNILVLANAAGATPRGAEADSVLRRFIGELAEVLGMKEDPIPQKAAPDEVDALFASLLMRVAQKRRVVILLDALDQFDATPRGRHLTWVKGRQWPANARLIATGIPGTGTDALCQWEGVEKIALPALEAADVTEIATRVWARYHRQVNPEVLRVLAAKRLPDGQAAAGNPLWLTLALEQINLLDADDFARAERDFSHIAGAGERLRALLVDTATRMPPDVPSLYGWLLEQTEKTYGEAEARAFAMLIALSRSGWRESDLLRLIPAAVALISQGQAPQATNWKAEAPSPARTQDRIKKEVLPPVVSSTPRQALDTDLPAASVQWDALESAPIGSQPNETDNAAGSRSVASVSLARATEEATMQLFPDSDATIAKNNNSTGADQGKSQWLRKSLFSDAILRGDLPSAVRLCESMLDDSAALLESGMLLGDYLFAAKRAVTLETERQIAAIADRLHANRHYVASARLNIFIRNIRGVKENPKRHWWKFW